MDWVVMIDAYPPGLNSEPDASCFDAENEPDPRGVARRPYDLSQDDI